MANKEAFEKTSKETSYKNKPYMNNQKMGQTEYKFNFGETVGSKPTDLMNGLSYKQPIRDNPLKYGTNQLWS